MKKIKIASVVLIACLGLINQLKAQMVVDNTITVNELVNDYLEDEIFIMNFAFLDIETNLDNKLAPKAIRPDWCKERYGEEG